MNFQAKPEGFPPELRLHYSWEYRQFFKGSEVVRTSACTLFRIPNDRGVPRIGITVKARVNSVQRNRVKRAIREAFRRSRPILGAYDYNAVIPGSRRVDHAFLIALRVALKEELPRALARAVPARSV